jgi:PAS domain S-box-containing protein
LAQVALEQRNADCRTLVPPERKHVNNLTNRLNRIATLALSLLFIVAVDVLVQLFFSTEPWEVVPFHSTLEALGTVAAMTTAAFVLLLRQGKVGQPHYVWIGSALISMGILDGFHASVLPGHGFVWLHSMATLAGGFLFVLVWLPGGLARSRWVVVLPWVVAIAATIFGALSVAFRPIFPVMVMQGEFTADAKIINLLAGLFFLAATVRFSLQYWTNETSDDFLFAGLCLLFGAASVMLPLSKIWHADWWLWHFLRLIAYFIALGHVFVVFKRTGVDLAVSKSKLETKVTEVARANQSLQAEFAERLQTEEVLRETRDYLEKLLRYANAPVIVWDSGRKVTLFNRAFEKFSGYRSDEVIGRDLEMLFPAVDKEEILKTIDQAIKGERWETVEIPIQRNDGERRIALWNSANIVDKEGKIIATIAQGQDITERKRAEAEARSLLEMSERSRNALLSVLEDQKQVEDALRETNDYLENLITYANAPIIVWDPQFRISRFNHAFETLTGRNAPEVLDKPLDLLFPPAQVESSMQLIKNTLAGERWETVEIEIQRKDGESRTVLWNSANILEKDGKTVVATIAQGHDITERKRAVEALSESEKRYRSLFVNMLEGFAYCRMLYDHDEPQDFVYIDVNNAFEELTGLKDVAGKKVSEVIPGIKESNPELFEIYGRVALTGKPERLETYVEPLGIWFSIAVYSPRKEYFIAVFDNITERKRAEQALQHYSERLAVINRLDRVITSSLEINEVYEAFVQEMSHLIAFDRTSIILLDGSGQRWQIVHQWTRGVPALLAGEWRLVAGSYLGWLVSQRQPLLEREIGERGNWPETELLRREGISSRVALPLMIKSQVIGAVSLASYRPAAYSDEDLGILRSVADQMAIAVNNSQLYHQIRTYATEMERLVAERTSDLEAANKELEAFSYSVSHDLRAPLRAIDGFSRIVLEEYAKKLDAEGNRLLNIVCANTQKMDQLITDLLDLSRATRDEMKFSRIAMTMLANSIYLEAASPEIRPKFSFSVAPIPDAYCDPSLMRQVWRNLISNAVKFTMPKDVRKIEIGSRSEKGMNTYFVKDSGVGFNPAYIDKLFGVFQRLHKAEEFEGTGVGLAIVQRIIHRHGGKVWAEGRVGDGATFWFSLPNRLEEIVNRQ